MNRQFALFATSTAIWAGGRVLYLTAFEHETALFWARFAITGVVFIPPLFLHFVYAFLKRPIDKPLFLSYVTAAFLFTVTYTGWMVKGVSIKYQSAYFVDPGPLYFLLLILFSIDLSLGFHLLRKRYRLTSGLERKQIRLLFWSLLIAFLGGATNFLPDFGLEVDSLSAYVTYVVPLYTIMITYAIIRYQLLDIEIAIQKSIVYLLTILIAAVPFFPLVTFFQAVFPQKRANLATFILLVGILLLFANIKPLTRQWVERSLFAERYRHYQSIHEFSQSIVRFLYLEDLTEKLFAVLTRTLHPTSISIFLSDGRGHFRLHRTFGLEEGSIDIVLPFQHPLIIKLEQQKDVLIREKLKQRDEESGMVQQMQDLQSDLSFPLIFEERLIGICNLGPKEGGKGYSSSELFMLRTLLANASIAFENARLFNEVKRYIEQLGTMMQAINLSPDIDQIFDLLIKEIQKFAPFEWASIAIYKEEGEVYFYRAKGSKETPLPEKYTWPLTDLNLLSRLSIKQEPLIQADLFDEHLSENEKKLAKDGVRSYLILPLWARGKLIGALNLWSPRPMERPAQTLELAVPLTNHLAPFLEVARLYEEMKKTNEALRQKSLELEASRRNQARFFSFVTHELRTPLNVILGYISLILEERYGPIQPKQASALSRLKENSILLTHLINDFLNLAQIESGKVYVRIEEVYPTEVLENLVASLEPLLLQKRIHVDLDINDHGPIYSDRLKLRQILQNLLSNAIRFTENGFIRIRVNSLHEKDGVLFEIADSGRGIAEKDLPHIFEPFWQGQSELSASSQMGSGLGLAIVKKTVEILKGEINVSSSLGKGTTFTLFFPCRYSAEQRKIV